MSEDINMGLRSQFEAYIIEAGAHSDFLERSKLGDDGYQHPTIHERWLGYKAAHNAQQLIILNLQWQLDMYEAEEYNRQQGDYL